MRATRPLVLALSLCATATASASAQAAGPPSRPVASRDDWQRVPDIIAALGLTRGSTVADVGAGTGWLSTRLAKFVGPSGQVFAVDHFEPAIRSLQRTVADDKLENIEIVRSEADDPRLPLASLDGIVIVNAYHEMTQHVAMLAGVRRALKATGVLVIVDNTPTDSTLPRSHQIRSHQLSIALAENDLVGSGFEIVQRDPGFIGPGIGDHPYGQWMLVARKVRE